MNSLYFAATFASSASDPFRCPASDAEVAFAGRSNAGKSSAINCITRNGKLARTSKTPGRTQLINHFALDGTRFLVDLPGYGYAQVSRSRQREWQAAMTSYLVRRQSLKGLILVMDIRRPLTDSDWQLIELQQRGSIGLHILLTKADKLSRSEAARTLIRTQKELEQEGVESTLQVFSAKSAEGVADAHSVLDQWLFDRELEL